MESVARVRSRMHTEAHTQHEVVRMLQREYYFEQCDLERGYDDGDPFYLRALELLMQENGVDVTKVKGYRKLPPSLASTPAEQTPRASLSARAFAGYDCALELSKAMNGEVSGRILRSTAPFSCVLIAGSWHLMLGEL